jgi:hypothetical protein
VSPISAAMLSGMPSRQLRMPGFSPSFFAKGVPE